MCTAASTNETTSVRMFTFHGVVPTTKEQWPSGSDPTLEARRTALRTPGLSSDMGRHRDVRTNMFRLVKGRLAEVNPTLRSLVDSTA